MADEMLDIVNEKNEVIGIEKKTVAVARNLPRRVVHVFIFNKKGELLMQKRSKNTTTSPGKLTSSACGHVQSKEDYETAAKRELKEEMGVEPKIRFVANYRLHNKTSNSFGAFFIGEHEGPFCMHAEEVASAQFMPLDRVRKLMFAQPDRFSSNFKEVFRIYLEHET